MKQEPPLQFEAQTEQAENVPQAEAHGEMIEVAELPMNIGDVVQAFDGQGNQVALRVTHVAWWFGPLVFLCGFLPSGLAGLILQVAASWAITFDEEGAFRSDAGKPSASPER